jgi:hypothetical protein
MEFSANLPYHVADSSAEIIDGAYGSIQLYYEKTCELEQ